MPERRTTPAAWVGPFLNILNAEEQRGFDNRAVIGGLDKFIELHAGNIVEDVADTEEALALLAAPYKELTREERPAWAGRWRALLVGERAESTGPAPGENAAPTGRATSGKAASSTPTGGKIRTAPRSKSAAGPEPEQSAYRQPPGGLTVDASIDRLRGVDEKLAARFQRLDVATVRDLLYLFPRRHLDYSNVVKISELAPGETCTVIGSVWEARTVKGGPSGRRTDTVAVLSDETGNLRTIWFGQRHMARTLKPNTRVAVAGRVEIFQNQVTFESPDYEILSGSREPLHTGRLVPVYPLTEGLTGRTARRVVRQALDGWLGGVDEFLPGGVLSRNGLMPVRDAIMQAHYPDDDGAWERARRRLAFDELFILQLAVLSRRRHRAGEVEGIPIPVNREALDGFFASLPFSLTEAQSRCVKEIFADMERGTPPMNRLLQGDVGSGKTVVALAGCLAAAAAGWQSAVMVPTEVLAEQHFETVSRLLSGMSRPVQEDFRFTVYLESLGRPVSVGLLTGSTRRAAKRELTRMAGDGSLDIAIGTQALIQTGVAMPNLGLAVADEQHRFGVMQRGALRSRGQQAPHTLIMSATPIPRTLSLTLYGDLDISTIGELPAGRQEIATRWVSPERRRAAYEFIRKQVGEGRQGFVICPLVDESEAIESKAATEEHKRLSEEVFPDLRVGLLHGRMSAKDKDARMREFRDGEMDILVSTAVVEVGIDVPNATAMLIEGADRFGLAQLHQFRGRVGRGEHKSYCLLLSDSPSANARERLSALESIHDGFRLAETDLELRGPGDFFGTRQSGLPNLRMAHVSDVGLLHAARDEVSRLNEADPGLTAPEHAPLAERTRRFLGQVSAV